ncbi:hypothetical protein CpipJ_CPIJ019210 [Culex quinquefasciatus]|uniref:Uncharacterized protein n=1 Tax=Culex quinquefasciatus TaxID=7176 RepID=B0XI90_CULQU|nr:hypothetical protein CpipJ_CPIJ019210 [Culex quinquefasciatus]|eukprot:XP_001869362.1 hypothetical protein CpipJ_CPIJ019210 [Culex quinquefasciatus]
MSSSTSHRPTSPQRSSIVRESSASPNSRPENRKGKYGPPGPVYGPVGANRDTMPADVCTDAGRVSPYRPPRNRPRPGPARNRQRWLPPKVGMLCGSSSVPVDGATIHAYAGTGSGVRFFSFLLAGDCLASQTD